MSFATKKILEILNTPHPCQKCNEERVLICKVNDVDFKSIKECLNLEPTWCGKCNNEEALDRKLFITYKKKYHYCFWYQISRENEKEEHEFRYVKF